MQTENDNPKPTGNARWQQRGVLRLRYLITIPCYLMLGAVMWGEAWWRYIAVMAVMMLCDILSFTGILIDKD